MSKAITAVLALLGLIAGMTVVSPSFGADPTAAPAGGAGPEDVVRSYVGSLKSGDLGTAYEQLTPHMTRGQAKEAWIAEQTAVFKLGEVVISSFEVFPARSEGPDKARVPNLLRSKDKFINQTGADEYELYTVVRGVDGRWRIDLQELVETDNVSKWFPPGAGK